MTDRPILFVAGFGRCGTTMMMTMLDAGGFPVAGPRPAYEVDEMLPGRIDRAWVRAQAGRAVKYIDPLVARISRNDLPVRPIIIHMRRDVTEMARSQIKMLEMAGYAIGDRRRAVRAFAADLTKKAPTLQGRIDALGTVYHFSFEWVLAEPNAAARKLGAIIAEHFDTPLDIAAAAFVPEPRSPLCAPDMARELRHV